jgi:hypothetical protein
MVIDNSPNRRTHTLSHRGVEFSLSGEGRGYRWTVRPASGPPKTALTGLLVGISSFRRSHVAAVAVIDLWLAHHPGDGGEA